MNREKKQISNKNIFIQQQTEAVERIPNPDVISVPQGYQIEVFAQGLDTPINIIFNEEGDMIIADSGEATGNAKIIRLSNGSFETIAEGFHVPLTGVNHRNGDLYVSHRGTITIVRSDGTRLDIIRGLPSFGDFSNNQVVFSPDNNKMYFGQGTATNSGVVGLDNQWIFEHPYFHDQPGGFVLVRGANYETPNLLIPSMETASTGAFSPFSEANIQQYTMLEGVQRATGSIMRANPDGSDLELVAWGFRNPVKLKFDQFNRIFVSNQGMDNRGSRPIANAPDELQLYEEGMWYGWPDYAGGDPVTLPRFAPEGGEPPGLLLANIPSVPPRPVAVFPAGSTIMGFDINFNQEFGRVGDVYIAKFGRIFYEPFDEVIRSGVGHRVTRVNINTGDISTFAINKSGFPQDDGLGRPTDVVFGPDGAMYVSDYSLAIEEFPRVYLPGTGVIWRISRV